MENTERAKLVIKIAKLAHKLHYNLTFNMSQDAQEKLMSAFSTKVFKLIKDSENKV